MARGGYRAPTPTPDIGDFAIIPLLLGFYLVFFNLDDLLRPGLSNQLEKALLIVAAILFMASRKMSGGRLFLVLVFASIPAISLLGTDYNYTTLGRFIRGFISYITPWLLMTITPKERDARWFLIGVSFIPLFCVVLGVGYDALGKNPMFYRGHEGANRLQGSSIPAFLAAGSALATFTALCCARHFDQRFFILVGLNLAILALTGGRMALAIALLAGGFIVLTRYRITPALILQGVVAVVALVAVGFMAFPDLIHRIQSDTDSGRGPLWAALIHVWNNHPYFGIGLGHQTLVVPESVLRYVLTIAAHNEYIRLGVEIGWVGLGLLGAAIAALMYVNWASPPKRGDLLFPLMCLLFLLFSYSDNALSLPTIFGLMTAAYFEKFVGVDKPQRILFMPFQIRPPFETGR